MKTIRFAALAWLLSLALVALGCRNDATSKSSSTASTSTLIYGRSGDANTLDPINTDIGEAVKVIINLYDTLVTYHDETMERAPGLATHWEHSDDGLTWTFHLRDGVKFHDGTPCDAEAVVFSFDRLIQEKHPHVYDEARPYRSSFTMIRDVVAVDARTVEFRLRQPSAVFLNNLAMFPASIVSPAAVKAKGKQFATSPVGSGPFKFERWKPDQQLVLAANPDHWRGRPKVDRVVFVPISDSTSRVQQLKQGTIHLAEDLPPAELDALAGSPGIVVQEQEGMNTGYLTMQMEKPPLNILKVRLAIAHAIDKRGLCTLIYANHARPAVNLVPPTMWGHHDDLVDHAFDPDRAKQLLREAADEAGFALPVRLKLAVMSQPRPYMQQPLPTASFIKDALGQIGIEATVEPRPINQHFPHMTAGNHELGLAGWYTDNNDPDNFLYSLLDSDNIADNGNNLSRYRSDAVHQLLLAGQRELDEPKRRTIYREAQEIIFADCPVVPLVHSQIRVAHRSTLKGYKLHPSLLPRLRHAWIEAAP